MANNIKPCKMCGRAAYCNKEGHYWSCDHCYHIELEPFEEGDSKMSKLKDVADMYPETDLIAPYKVVNDWQSGSTAKPKHCRHNQDKIMMGGYEVWLSGIPAKSVVRETPDIGIYLDPNVWSREFNFYVMSNCDEVDLYTKQKVMMVDWPDRKVVPMNILKWLVDYAVRNILEGKIVEMACWGGHGRTGTLSACVLAMIEGLDGDTAIREIRHRHCECAIETKDQEELVRQFCAQYVENLV